MLSVAPSLNSSLRRLGLWLVVMVMLVVAVAACADDDTGHQFANDPQPEPSLPTAPARIVAPPRATPLASPVAAENLLRTRGAAGRFYYEADETLWSLAPADEQPAPVYSAAAGTVIRALAASPSGDRVAALLVREDEAGETADIVVLANSGDVLFEYAGIDELGSGEDRRAFSLDWSPQGEKLLVGVTPGGLIAVPLDAAEPPFVIVDGDLASSATSAAWSPTGEEVGFLAPGATDNLGLYLAAPEASPVAVPSAGGSDKLILDWTWLPDGRSILFSEQDVIGGNADLWRILIDGRDRELVASAGRVAPVARILNATPSRDGRSVAYVVVVPGAEQDEFHSLWVRSLESNQGYPIALPEAEAVTDLWWTNAGLLVRTVPAAEYAGTYRSGDFRIYQLSEGTNAQLVVDSMSGTPVASPVAPE